MVFILPKWGGSMVHSDPQQTDNINLPVPRNDVEILWRKNELNGEKAGTIGNGIAGNATIAACTFNGKSDNLVIYDYNGERIWTSGNLLNAVATTSTPMVSIDNRVCACDNEKIIIIGPKDKNNPFDDEFEIEWIHEIPTPPQGPSV
jgi:hypothetical protein